ncbi:MAG: diguanylate cyclase [Actinomycetota bacterium]|nr:diguanylate cyclase [Actinomycetota bacterium]
MAELFGYQKQEVENRKNIKELVLAEENEKLSANIFKLARGQMVGRNEYTALRKDKKIIPVLSDSMPLRDPQGKVIGIRTVFMDIVQRKEFENRLKESEEKFRIFFNNANDPIFLYEFDPRKKRVSNFLEVNQVAIERYGYTREEFLNMSIKDLLDKDSCKKLPLILNMISSKGRHTFEVTHLLEGGKKILVEVSCRMYSRNDKDIVLSTVRDITERKKAENQIRYYSFHDKLTGLYNRSYFEEELKRLDTRRQLPLSIIMGDLDGLKLINDAFGHLEGDKLLVKTAKLLVECFREEDIVARWGGDEFAILLPKTDSRTANELINRIKDKIKVETIQRIPLSISLGLATKSKAYQQIEEKLIEAEGFMYRAKLNEAKKVAKLVIDSLRKALSEKLHHTPQIDNIKFYAKELGKMCGLKVYKLDVLMLLCDFYDIGLISIPDATLLSRRKLNKKDVKNIQKHPEVGYRICVASPHLSSIAFDVLSHHEWWNGNGYPQGLKGNQIPLNSRIIAIIDAYKAMVNNRPYHKAMGMDKIVNEIRAGAGKQFDPDLVEKFISLILKD